MAENSEPVYDSFVIRLWHTSTTDQLLRAEIAHVQTEAVYVGRGVNLEWISDTVKMAIAAPAKRGGAVDPAVDDDRN